MSSHNTLDATQTDLLRSSGAALFTLAWEWAITFDDEVELIWQRDNRSALKWLYLFSRYFIFAGELQISPGFRDVHQILSTALAVSSLEAVLMIRVYALYLRKRWVAIFLSSLLVVELLVAVVGAVITLHDDSFMLVDILGHLPTSFVYFGISGLIVQCIMLGLTLVKYSSDSMKTVPIVRLMMRDGTLTFLLVTLFGLVVVIYTIRHSPLSVTLLAWLLTVISASSCRLIINCLRLPAYHDHLAMSTSLQFTTILTDRIPFETLDDASQDNTR